jgi:REP element-mobilizing transposase RayT
MSMVFDLKLHPGRKSLRMPYRDYATAGIYFVTICTHDRRPTLARIIDGTVELTPIGEIAKACWSEIPLHYSEVNIYAFVVMPNHIHGLLRLSPCAENPPQSEIIRRKFGPDSLPAASLSAVVRSLKSAVTKRAREMFLLNGDCWQRNYFERAIRSGKEFDDATQYIIENPLKWAMDKENPDGGKTLRSR